MQTADISVDQSGQETLWSIQAKKLKSLLISTVLKYLKLLTQSCTGSIHKFLDIHKGLMHGHHDELLLGASSFTEQGLQAAVVLLSRVTDIPHSVLWTGQCISKILSHFVHTFGEFSVVKDNSRGREDSDVQERTAKVPGEITFKLR